MLNIWILIFFTLCHFFSLSTGILFLHCFYDSGFRWHRKKAWLLLVFAVTQAIINFILAGNALLNNCIHWLATIIEIIVLLYDYPGSKRIGFKRFLIYWVLSLFITNIYSEVVYSCMKPVDFLSIFNNIDYNNITIDDIISTGTYREPILIINILGTVFFGAVFFYLYQLYRKNVVMRCRKREMWLLLGFASTGYILSFITTLFSDNNQILLYSLAIMTLLFASLFPVFIYSSRIGAYYHSRTAIQEQHIQAELAHFQQYRQAQEETSRFRHDIRNNLLCINDMLQQGKSDDASEYLKDLLEIVENTSRKYVTGDDLLDSIVGVKTQIMEQHGIRFELDGVLAGGLTWKPMDICNVFANALDNAIEACQKVAPEKRRISMSIKATSQFWFVTIENPVSKKVDTSKLFQKNGGYTSKSNSAKHGIGTYNMKHTVESYGAMLKADCTDEIFKLEIMIDKRCPEQK